jgi:hypothetical protein
MSSINSIDPHGTLQWDMIELARHLRQERLFVNSEQQNLQTLNERVCNVSIYIYIYLNYICNILRWYQ